MARGDKRQTANSDPLARVFVAVIVILIGISMVLGIRLVFFTRAAEPAAASPALSRALDDIRRRIMAGVDQLSSARERSSPPPAAPARSPQKQDQPGAPGNAAVLPRQDADPNRSYAPAAAPQGPQVLPVPSDGQWTYAVFFGPAWNQGGRLHYVTERMANQPGKTGAGMSWLPEGGSASKWFLGVVEPDHPSHANTRFPGFFMHPAYLPQSLQPGSRVLWEFPWQGGGRGQVRRFDMRVVDWETVKVPAGEFTAVHLKGRLQYVDNEAIKADIDYRLWYAPRARQVVRLLWLGRSPDEANGEMIAELSSFTAP